MSDNNQETAGVFLKRTRERSGKTQRQVAKDLQLAPECISEWETDRKKMSAKWLERIVSLYQLDEEEKATLVTLTGYQKKRSVRKNNVVQFQEMPSDPVLKVLDSFLKLSEDERQKFVKALDVFCPNWRKS